MHEDDAEHGRHVAWVERTCSLLSGVSGLAFVGFEVRQNNVLAEAAAYQQIGVATAAAWDTQAHDLQFLTSISEPAEAMNSSAWRQWAVKTGPWPGRIGYTDAGAALAGAAAGSTSGGSGRSHLRLI